MDRLQATGLPEITGKIISTVFHVGSDHTAFARRSSGARTPEKGKNHSLCLHGEKTGIALKGFLVDTNRDIVSELQTLPPGCCPASRLGCGTGIPHSTYRRLSSDLLPHICPSRPEPPQLRSSTCSSQNPGVSSLFLLFMLCVLSLELRSLSSDRLGVCLCLTPGWSSSPPPFPGVFSRPRPCLSASAHVPLPSVFHGNQSNPAHSPPGAPVYLE